MGPSDDQRPLPAGDFSPWVAVMLAAIGGERGSDVPCGACTACCTSSQFVHIEPDETDALAHIPSSLRFPAPRLPPGHAVMGYDEHGHCPMLVDGACSIYAHRPRACRTYDCRVFPAAGLSPEEPTLVGIARQAARWQFSHPTDEDRRRHDAVQRAARFLVEHPDVLPGGASISNTTTRAAVALEVHGLFLDPECHSDAQAVRVALDHRSTTSRRP
jgi:uncharacterized protein